VPVWREEAIEDLLAIVDYITQAADRLVAVDFGDRLFADAAKLDTMPSMGRKGRERGTREWVLHPNYIAIYRITKAGQVEILNIVPTRKLWS
jgi:plasmid stabilization system protein ParE